MKVLILTEGSPEIGFGHITRCTAIRQALMKVDPEIETKMVILSPGNAQKFLGDYLSDADIFDWHSSREQTKILAQKYDVVIVDSYLAPVSIYEMLSQQLDGKLFMIDDYNRIDYPQGTVISPSIYGDQILYKQKEGVQYLLGRKYVILRREFWDNNFKNINKEV
ncbi:MAG: UDP-2,4-diacetamido-2,4,6-trideoxy-beta-L-altropyranose hydrolase, partial [Candidatus Omnitrophica bacterium]|nr:UDP-2,4-diacetamido-2,4,6-trideoxy-beta-L-altropyranose hydrolase [Candidatus Omnitrophota bacterium]